MAFGLIFLFLFAIATQGTYEAMASIYGFSSLGQELKAYVHKHKAYRSYARVFKDKERIKKFHKY